MAFDCCGLTWGFGFVSFALMFWVGSSFVVLELLLSGFGLLACAFGCLTRGAFVDLSYATWVCAWLVEFYSACGRLHGVYVYLFWCVCL